MSGHLKVYKKRTGIQAIHSEWREPAIFPRTFSCMDGFVGFVHSFLIYCYFFMVFVRLILLYASLFELLVQVRILASTRWASVSVPRTAAIGNDIHLQSIVSQAKFPAEAWNVRI
jgi:hypothetical protein